MRTRSVERNVVIDPIVTVVLSSYNRPKLVTDAIESVREQTLEDWQLIVADDDSNEETRRAILKAARHDSRIEVDLEPSALVPVDRFKHARFCVRINDVIPKIRGRFVAYLCDDDYYYPESLAVRVGALLASPKIHVCYGRLRSISYDLKGEWDSSAVPMPGRTYPRGDEDDPETGRPINPSTWIAGVFSPIAGRLDHNQVMHRRDCFSEIGGHEIWPTGHLETPGDVQFFQRLDKIPGHGALAVDAYVVTKRYHRFSYGRLDEKTVTVRE